MTIKTPLELIKDENLKERIKKLSTMWDDNYDKKTWQYLWYFEFQLPNYFWSEEEKKQEQKENTIKNKIKSILEKIEDKYYDLWIHNKIEKIWYRLKNAIRMIKDWETNENYSWNLDYKFLEIVEKNLPNYKMWHPCDLSEKQWELIKSKLIKISRILLEKDVEDCEFYLIKKYKYDIEIEWEKLIYSLISKEEFDKKIKECMKEKEKLQKEFSELLWQYLFNFWD